MVKLNKFHFPNPSFRCGNQKWESTVASSKKIEKSVFNLFRSAFFFLSSSFFLFVVRITYETFISVRFCQDFWALSGNADTARLRGAREISLSEISCARVYQMPYTLESASLLVTVHVSQICQISFSTDNDRKSDLIPLYL